jgi:hypothetical protein
MPTSNCPRRECRAGSSCLWMLIAEPPKSPICFCTSWADERGLALPTDGRTGAVLVGLGGDHLGDNGASALRRSLTWCSFRYVLERDGETWRITQIQLRTPLAPAGRTSWWTA